MKRKAILEVLNDLIKINDDRSQIYENAIEKLGNGSNADVVEAFSEIAHKSQVFKNELSGSVWQLDGEPSMDSEAHGDVYKLWNDLKTAFTEDTSKTVLEFCEFGEDAALKAYEEALKLEDDYPPEIEGIIRNQKEILENSHETVKQYRDTF